MKIILPFMLTLLFISACEADIEATDNSAGDKSEVNVTVDAKQKEEVNEDDHSLTKMSDKDIEKAKNYKW